MVLKKINNLLNTTIRPNSTSVMFMFKLTHQSQETRDPWSTPGYSRLFCTRPDLTRHRVESWWLQHSDQLEISAVSPQQAHTPTVPTPGCLNTNTNNSVTLYYCPKYLNTVQLTNIIHRTIIILDPKRRVSIWMITHYTNLISKHNH